MFKDSHYIDGEPQLERHTFAHAERLPFLVPLSSLTHSPPPAAGITSKIQSEVVLN